jgi:hypothetical protein
VKLLSFDNDRLLKVRIGLLAVLYGAGTYYFTTSLQMHHLVCTLYSRCTIVFTVHTLFALDIRVN